MTAPRPSLLRPALPWLASLAAAALACASGPPGEPAKKREVLSTTYDDARVGEEASHEVAAEIGVIDDPELEAYVAGIGRKLLRGVPRRGFDYQFKVVDMVEPNAFALPGGYIFISRGLLVLANDEDELACIIGHEITHAAKRHAAAQQALARSISPIAMPWKRAGQMATYARDMERDADEGGQFLCAAAGYDPIGMSTFLRSLEQFERLRRGFSGGTSFFDTHPSSRERAGSNAVRASEIRWRRDPAIGDPRRSLLTKIENLAVGPRPEAGLFAGDRFLHPKLDFTIRFPTGWSQVNTNQAVGALAPRGDAIVYLTADQPAGEPRQMAEAWIEEARTTQRLEVLESKPVKVGAIDAWRMKLDTATGGGDVISYVTFIPYHEATWRITGMARAIVASKYLGRTLSASRSFRPLDDRERDSIRVARLHATTARAGESLAALTRRSGNGWDPQTTAVFNGLFVNHRFAGGEQVKIIREEAYVPTD